MWGIFHMGFVFRKRDAILIVIIVVAAAIVFALGFIAGAGSHLFDKAPIPADDDLPAPARESSAARNSPSRNVRGGGDAPDAEGSAAAASPVQGDIEASSPPGVETTARSQPETPAEPQPETAAEPQPENETQKLREERYIDRWVDLYAGFDDDDAVGELGPQNVEIIERRDGRIKIETELGENWIDADSIRRAVLLDVPSYDQRALGYPLGCEMVSLAMMMNYATEVSVHDLVEEMPRADHPDEGFRGDPASSSRGWTIFPPALSGLMVKYLGNSYDMSSLEMYDLKFQLNTNTPILVWVSGLGWAVHALCLTGYDDSGFFYNDPWTGEKDAFIIYGDFYEIWNKPIYDSVLDLTYSPRKALSYRP